MRTGPLRRHLLRIERGLASYRPVAPPPTPREPPRAAATLAALDRAYQPGDAIGNREIAAAGAVSRNDAAAILRTLRRYRRPMTGGELLFYGCPGVLAAERDAALSELEARGLVVALDRPYVQR